MRSRETFVKAVLDLPRSIKRGIALSIDLALCALAVWVAFYLRLGEWISFANPSWNLDYALIIGLLLSIPIFVISGFYRAIFRYSGWAALKTIVQSSTIYGSIYALIFTFYGVSGVPRTVGFIQPILLLFFVGASRALASQWLGQSYKKRLRLDPPSRALIYGAGSSGRQLAAALVNNHEIHALGFVDDDKALSGSTINGLSIYHSSHLTELIRKKRITDVLLAIPSASRQRRNEVLKDLQHIQVAVRTLPSVVDLATGKIDILQMRELDVDDLLGRQPVAPNQGLLQACISNKVVMVTGAGGSIGGELCRQILLQKPKTLLLIEQGEFALYQIQEELLSRQKYESEDRVKLIPLIASVCDRRRMNEIIATWKPDTIFHAAAYKHVPLVEHNPSEGIRNNVYGTLITAQCAIQNQVKNFVLISTDKAVRPTNIMGATKRLAENVLQALSTTTQSTIFTMVRFGNVLDSSGSVVPKFRQQIAAGGPISLTDAEITRYFMTIPEAAQLVIQAGAMGLGGDVFVLDMGEPVRIMDLARNMIELSGLSIRDESNPEGEIAIEITGLRPGEKLYEELLIGDNPILTNHPRIMKAHEDFIQWDVLELRLAQLERLLETGDPRNIRETLAELVPGYKPTGELVDWILLKEAGKPS